MSLPVDDDVLGLEVAIKDALSVKVLQGRQGFQEVEAGLLLPHAPDSSEEVEEFSAVAVLHGKH